MRHVLMMVVTAGGLLGQVMTVPPGPFAPGGTVPIAVLNNTATQSFCANSGMLALISAEGELAAPRLPATTDACISHGPGVSRQYALTLPALGPGSNGSFILLALQGLGAVARVNVGAPAPGFPAIHSFPTDIAFPITGHAFNPAPNAWTIANVSPAAFTFGQGATLEVRALDLSLINQVSLTGIVLAPNSLIRIPLPVAGLPPAPYFVEARWNDPIAGNLLRRFGIRDNAGADIGLPVSKSIPLNGNIEVRMNGRVGAPTIQALQHLYALAIGTSPGLIPLPNGNLLPLANEPLVWSSLTPGALGAITGNLGVTTPVGFPGFYLLADSILIAHPGPALSGLDFRIAGVFTEPLSGYWAPTQVEIITLQ